MLNYLVVEVSGRQYKVEPGKKYKVDFLGDVKAFECDKVIARNDDKGFVVGSPYLKEKVNFEVLGDIKGKKIRVATYKAKANTRKVIGSRKLMSFIQLSSGSKA